MTDTKFRHLDLKKCTYTNTKKYDLQDVFICIVVPVQIMHRDLFFLWRRHPIPQNGQHLLPRYENPNQQQFFTTTISDLIPKRFVIAIMLFTACFVSYMMRVNMSINLIAMVEPAKTGGNLSIPECAVKKIENISSESEHYQHQTSIPDVRMKCCCSSHQLHFSVFVVRGTIPLGF